MKISNYTLPDISSWKFYRFLFVLLAGLTSTASYAQTEFTSVTSDNSNNTLVVQWQRDQQAMMVFLMVSASPGGSELGVYDVTTQAPTSIIPTPEGVDPVHLTLYTITSTVPQQTHTSISPSSSALLLNILSPTDESTLTDKLTTLNWEWNGGRNSHFQVSVGLSPGSNELGNYMLAASERIAPLNVPLDGTQVHVSVLTTTGAADSDAGVTYHVVNASYQTATSGSDSGTHITAPQVDSTLSEINTTFEWSPDPLASSFEVSLSHLENGSSYYAREVINDPSINQVSLPVALDGNASYLTIKTTWRNGAQYSRTYQYSTIFAPDSDGDGIPDKWDAYPLQNNSPCQNN